MKPNDVNVRTDLGLTFVFRKPEKYDRAIAEFRKSLEVNPKHEQTLQNLAFALAQKQDMTEAQAVLKKLEEVNPKEHRHLRPPGANQRRLNGHSIVLRCPSLMILVERLEDRGQRLEKEVFH
ncbi:MAG: tetratricopeptide repeat protein [Pyrinomonadaceae bacterium]